MKDFVERQNDIADCGACALSSLIKYYNGYVPLEIIKVDTLTNSEGTNFYNLKEAAIKYGFEVNGYNSKNIRVVNTPYIAQLNINNMYHFVVVYKVFDKYLLCMDPAVGMKKYSKEEFKSLFTGNILKLNPLNKIVKYHKNNYFKNLLFRTVKDNLFKLSILILFSFIIIGISLFTTYSIKLILNNNYRLIILFIILLVVKNALNYLKNNIIAHLNRNNNIILIKDYLNHFFYLPFKYLQLKSSGEIISRISDLNNIKDFFTKEIINIFLTFIILVASLIIMFNLSFILTLIIFISSLIFLFINYLLNKKCFNYYLKYLDSSSFLMDNIIESINNLTSIKNLGKENFFLSKLNTLVVKNSDDSLKLEQFLNKLNILSNLFNDFCLVIIILFSFNNNALDILIYILYYNYFIDNINYYNNIIPNISYFKSVLSRLNGIYYLDKEKVNIGLKVPNNDIEITNLSYDINLNKIFDKYNLKINANDKVLIKGINGVGKSTLLNILNGNITDYTGDIKIGKENIKKISKKSLKENVLYCTDADNLFTDTIYQNILLNQKYDEKKFKKIESILDLKEIINKKENGYNTIVKNNVSRGERQRIILARALYQDAKILLFDEALSEIGYHLRNKIIKNINNYYQDKTIIYVSHNLEGNYFDKIINLTARKERKNA